MLPDLLDLASEEEYRNHYLNTLVNGDIIYSVDGVEVVFHADRFEHAFSGYSNKWDSRKDIFDIERARRINWIAPVIQGVSSESYRDDHSTRKPRRIYLSSANKYVVVTEPITGNREKFITAFPCGDSKASQVRRMPKWKKNSRC